MANAKGFVTLAIDGKAIKLRFDFNAIADAEELLGRPVHRLFDGDQMGFREIRALLYAGSQGMFKTVKDAGRVVTPDNMAEVAQAIGEALNAAFGQKDEEESEGE